MSRRDDEELTREAVQTWLDTYWEAWQGYDRDLVASLWTDDAAYRWHPADEPTVGRDAIVDAWMDPESRDDQGTYEGAYTVYAVDGNRAVAIGTSEYWTDASRATRRTIYYNSWLLEFGPDGRCSSFTEYWILPRGS